MHQLQLTLMDHEIDTDRLVLVVAGAHLRAEAADRPMAYSIRERILEWLGERFGDRSPLDVLVCSDIWVLNNEDLRTCPTISVGGPGVNAFAAYLADKLPSAFVIEDQLMVQADLDFDDVIASCWGMDHGSTVAAVDAFLEKYLDPFMEAAVQRVGA